MRESIISKKTFADLVSVFFYSMITIPLLHYLTEKISRFMRK